MRKRTIVLLIFCLIIFSESVFANSSWMWLTKTRPWHLLPIAIVLTLFLETYFIRNFGRVNERKRVLIYVTIANLLSFLSSYLMVMFLEIPGYPWEKFIERNPFYNIGYFYVITTIIIELPLVYFGLRKEVKNKGHLFWVIFFSNLFTTGLVAVIERVFAYGRW